MAHGVPVYPRLCCPCSLAGESTGGWGQKPQPLVEPLFGRRESLTHP